MSFNPILDSRPVGVFDEENRRPTNVCWIYLFGIAIFTFVVFIGLAIQSPGPAGIILDRNWYGKEGRTHCGIDSNVLDRKLRIQIDDRKSYGHMDSNNGQSGICVKSCPKGSFDASTCDHWTFSELKRKLLCKNDKLKDDISNCDQLKAAVSENNCVGWYSNTFELFGHCFSHTSSEMENNIAKLEQKFGNGVLTILPNFIYAIVIAGVVSLTFALTLKWCAGTVFWGFVVVIVVGFLVIMTTLICIQLPDARYSNRDMESIYWQFGIMAFFLFVFILFLYLFRNKIRCGIEIVKESSHCVCASFGSIFFPILPLLLRASVLIASLYIAVMAYTLRENHYEIVGKFENCICTNNYYEGQTCTSDQFNKDCHALDGGICTETACKVSFQSASSFTKIWLVLTSLLSTWIVASIQAYSKMILAHVYGNWYWTGNKQYIPNGAVLTATKKIFRYHTGTAAFGGFVVMLLRAWKRFLTRRHRIKCCGALFSCIVTGLVRCVAGSIIDLLQFVSDKAFVVSAIMGYGFWDSVKSVAGIMMRDIPLVIATERVGDIILFVCKFVAAALSAGLFYGTSPFKGNDAYITYIAAALIFWFAFDLAAVLLTAYNVAIDTLLICTLQDYLHNGVEKPYFKSQVLNGLLLKKPIDHV